MLTKTKIQDTNKNTNKNKNFYLSVVYYRMTVYNIEIEVGEFERDFTQGYYWEPEENKEDVVNIRIKRKDNWEIEIKSKNSYSKKPFCNKAAIKDIIEDADIGFSH